MAVGIGHTAFHRLFGWEAEFAKVSALNRKVFTTIHVATTLFLLVCGFLTFRYAALLAQPAEAASVVCLAFGLFWSWRLLWQLFYFRPSRLKPRRHLLMLHYALILLFALLTVGYGAPLATSGSGADVKTSEE